MGVKTRLLASGKTEDNEFDISLLGFKMAVNENLTVFNLVDGVVDEFHDESGTDEAEGSNDNLKVLCRYDFDDNNVPQPSELSIGSLASPAVFGTAVFASAVFGQTLFPQQKINLTGSGFTNNFRIRSAGNQAPYTVSGFYVDFIAGGRI